LLHTLKEQEGTPNKVTLDPNEENAVCSSLSGTRSAYKVHFDFFPPFKLQKQMVNIFFVPLARTNAISLKKKKGFIG